jgi:acetyltransferase-like isoleucine patch superfamily enzyme
MSFVNQLIYRIKRSDSWLFRLIKGTLRAFSSPTIPPVPGFLRAPLRAAYELHFAIVVGFNFLLTVLYRNPIFQGRCASFGRRVSVEGLPYVTGHVEIHLGDDVHIGGKVAIHSGSVFEQPKLIVKDRSAVGWFTAITVNQEVIIEEDVIVSYECRISDSDAHRREADLRAAGLRPDPKDIRPVRICRYAFVGNGSQIMKGVTVGEGAMVAAHSVVISDVPPYSLVMGNPAEVVMKNYGRPSTSRKKTPAAGSTESVSSVPAVDH